MTTTQLEGSPSCPKCGHTLDGATDMHDDPDGPEPRPGDVTVCIKCANPLFFTSDKPMQLQALTPDQFLGLDDELRLDLTKAIRAVRTLHERKGE